MSGKNVKCKKKLGIINCDCFFYFRLLNDIALENTEQYETFSLRPLDGICLSDPIMRFLIRKVQHIGQSIELLVSLDRITDIWKINIGNDGIEYF